MHAAICNQPYAINQWMGGRYFTIADPEMVVQSDAKRCIISFINAKLMMLSATRSATGEGYSKILRFQKKFVKLKLELSLVVHACKPLALRLHLNLLCRLIEFISCLLNPTQVEWQKCLLAVQLNGKSVYLQFACSLQKEFE